MQRLNQATTQILDNLTPNTWGCDRVSIPLHTRTISKTHTHKTHVHAAHTHNTDRRNTKASPWTRDPRVACLNSGTQGQRWWRAAWEQLRLPCWSAGTHHPPSTAQHGPVCVYFLVCECVLCCVCMCESVCFNVYVSVCVHVYVRECVCV
jgi:hypothetical protein